MNLFQSLLSKLRTGTATEDEIDRLDRRGFLLGVAATAGGLVVARPKIFTPPPPKVRREVFGTFDPDAFTLEKFQEAARSFRETGFRPPSWWMSQADLAYYQRALNLGVVKGLDEFRDLRETSRRLSEALEVDRAQGQADFIEALKRS